MKKLFRKLVNFLVPTPATVRKQRAPSARFATLAAIAATRGDSLTRDGRSYNLVSGDLATVREFDNLAQVKAFLGEATGLIACTTPALTNTATANVGLAPVSIVPVTNDIVRE